MSVENSFTSDIARAEWEGMGGVRYRPRVADNTSKGVAGATATYPAVSDGVAQGFDTMTRDAIEEELANHYIE